MEEEGTEILFRPGTETILKEHFSSQVSATGVGELNLLQYCTTEETDEVHQQQKEITSTLENISETDGRSVPLSTTEDEERQPESINRSFFPASTRGQPPSHSTPNSSSCVTEDGENESVEQSDNHETSGRFHPALKAALYTEGQEAVWQEDHYSTISSVYLEPEKAEATSSSSNPQGKSRNRMKVPFFKSLGKKKQPLAPEESTTQPVKIHVKKKKVTKAVLLLPPKGAGTETMKNTEENPCNEDNVEKEKLMKENEMYAAIAENSVQARRLLDSVLSGNDLDEEESERMAKEAFSRAAAARRIAYRSGYHAFESDVVNEGQVVQEAIELERVMSYLAEEGEQAVLQHRQQRMDEDSDEENSDDEDEGDEESGRHSDANGLLKMEDDASGTTKKKKRGKFVVSEYASRAVHYLESIIPKNMGSNKDDGVTKGSGNGITTDSVQPALSSAEDFWSEAGISTLGMKNDTLEYGFSTDEGEDDAGDRVDHDGTGLLRNFDMMSLSSLNEILDGHGTEQKLSPRTAVREIGIPTRKQKGPPPTQPKRNRGGFLGLVTPRTMRCTNEKKKKYPIGDDDTSNEKKWGGFFRTPRGSEAVPSQLHLVMEEVDEDRVEDQSEKETSPTASDSVQEREAVEDGLAEAYSDSWLGVPKDSRYTPASVSEEVETKGRSSNRYRSIPQDNEIELKLSVATREDKDGNVADDHNSGIHSQEINSSHTYPSGEKKDDINKNRQGDLNSESISKERESRSLRNPDRYQTEPIGKTPKRTGLEMEENSNRKGTEDDEGKNQENTRIEEEGKEQDNLSLLSQVDDKECIVITEGSLPPKDSDVQKITSHEKSKMKIQKGKTEEMSIAASEGSKSKLFGRVVDMMGRNKRKLLVPNTVVEETFIVESRNKNVSTSLQKIHGATLQNGRAISGTETQSKLTVGQRAKTISKMNKTSTRPSYSVVGDSNTVIQQAISNGNLKAVESNEEGDDVVPLNYLTVMLKKKLNDEKKKTKCAVPELQEPPQLQFLDQKPDADSCVAAIRGPRHIEAPGVALEEIAIRNSSSNRDPITGDGTDEILVDLAPTPRRPDHGNCFDDDEDDDDEDENETNNIKTRDPPIKDEEDERQRRKMITERLFQAGSIGLHDENTTGKGISGDAMKTVPTVESAESYDEEQAEDPAKIESVSTEDLDIKDETPEKEVVREPNSHGLGRGRRKISISFLKGGKRK